MVIRAFAVLTLVVAGCAGALGTPAVRYEPTPLDVVQAMLALASVRPGDVVADLGCGDGRIVIEAVVRHGTRGLCVDIDPRRIAEARRNAAAAGVAERIDFIERDLFEVDLRGATVVMLFLSQDFNLRLAPKLRRELAGGARVVSHWHDMGDWRPDRVERMRSDGRTRPLYLWIIQ
jgi:SAM-dependent methyltransferase